MGRGSQSNMEDSKPLLNCYMRALQVPTKYSRTYESTKLKLSLVLNRYVGGIIGFATDTCCEWTAGETLKRKSSHNFDLISPGDAE